MKFTKLLLIGGLMFLGTMSLKAQQDIHFSQFYLSPLNLNPALTGVMNSSTRFIGNYRNQWSSVTSNPYTTYAFSYDGRMAVGRSDYFGYGLSFFGDKAGVAEFGQVSGKLSLSYSKKMGGYRNRSHYLVAGADIGAVQYSVNFLRLQFGSQFDGQRWDGNIDSGESFNREVFITPDISAGLMWFTVFDENSNIYVGGAFSHLNSPNVSFFGDETYNLASRLTINAGGEFMLSRTFGLVPGVVLFQQGHAFETNVGTSAKFLIGKRSSDYQAFQVGLWTRIARDERVDLTPDAMIISTRFDMNGFTLGFSYDITISELNTASNNNGGFELALVYQFGNSQRRSVYCPRF